MVVKIRPSKYGRQNTAVKIWPSKYSSQKIRPKHKKSFISAPERARAFLSVFLDSTFFDVWFMIVKIQLSKNTAIHIHTLFLMYVLKYSNFLDLDKKQ